MSKPRLIAAVAAGLLLAGALPPLASAAPTIPPRAMVYIADASEGGVVSVFDATTGQTSPGLGLPDSTFEDSGSNEMAVGDVNGDGRDEVLIANDNGVGSANSGRIDVLDPATGGPIPGLGVPTTVFSLSAHNQLAVGDLNGDGRDEVVIADHVTGGTGSHGRMYVYDATTGLQAPGLFVTDSTFDNDFHNQIAVGDVNGDGRDEIMVANDSGGRIDVLDATIDGPAPGLGIPDTRFNNHSHNQMAVGDVDGDLKDEVLIADETETEETEGGLISVFDATTGQTSPGLGISDSTFDNDDHNQIAVGDVNGDGRDEIMVANDSGGRIDVLDATIDGPAPGLGIPDTRFNNSPHNQLAVGTFTAEQTDTETQLAPPRPGFHGTSTGVATDARNTYAVHLYRTVADPSTSDKPGTLVVLDRKTMAVRAEINVGWGPSSVAVNPVTNRAYVVNRGQQSYSLSVIDTTTFKVVGEIPLGQTPIDVAVNTKLNRVYVSNPSQGVIHVINGGSNTRLPDVPVGPGAHGLAFDESTGTLSVALIHRDNDPTTPEIAALGGVVDDGVRRPFALAPVALGDPGTQPVDVAVDTSSGRIYVAGLGGGGIAPSVTVLNRARQIVARIPIAAPARAITTNPGAGLVFVAGENGVYTIDAAQQKVVRHTESGTAFAVATVGQQLYTGDFLDGKLRRRAYSSGTPQ